MAASRAKLFSIALACVATVALGVASCDATGGPQSLTHRATGTYDTSGRGSTFSVELDVRVVAPGIGDETEVFVELVVAEDTRAERRITGVDGRPLPRDDGARGFVATGVLQCRADERPECSARLVVEVELSEFGPVSGGWTATALLAVSDPSLDLPDWAEVHVAEVVS